MMRNKVDFSRPRRSRLALTGVCLSLCLVACGGSSGGSNGDGGGGIAPTPTPTASPTPPPAGVLPPDPGEAGTQTVAGIDSDNDGVRDDIQIYIDSLELSGANESESATQWAKGIQEAILTGDSNSGSDAVRSAAERLALAVDCASHVFGVDAVDQIALLELMALNTDARSAAYENFNAQTEGQQFGAMADQEVACE